jgi:LysR family nitrogen assimilation transcriptional regulator
VDLKKLHHCVTVADLGSFTRAASVLSVPQSVLSRQVRDVEQAIGLTLLHRTGRGASLRSCGRWCRTGSISRKRRDSFKDRHPG